MASSQVEMAPSPYSLVLRDHKRRICICDRESNSQAQADFQKNIKELVRDHLQTYIARSAPRDSEAASDVNSENRIHNQDCWAMEEDRNNFNAVNSMEETTESSAMRRRRSQILDRWATRQAREMITTIERQAHEAELLELSNSHTVSTRASTFLRETSPAQSDSSVDLPNLRASSLVQMWKEFEAEAETPRANQSCSFNSNSNSNSNSIFISDRINSTFRNIENVSVEDQPSVGSEVCDSTDERYEALVVPEDPFTDWESDHTVPSEQVLSPQGQVSDVGESERVRVVDIVRRLASGSATHSSWSDEIERDQHTANESSSLENSISDLGERRDFPFIGNSPRVRGRQAIMDLFTQMEQERLREVIKLGERHVVSQFSHRGRIQALLRIRFLQHEVAVQDQRHPPSTASELDQLQQQNTIFLLREHFSPRIERNGREVLSGEVNLRSHIYLQNNTLDSVHSGLSDQLTVQDTHREAANTFEQNTTQVHHSMTSIGAQPEEEPSPTSDVTLQETSLRLENATPSQGWEEDATMEELDPDTTLQIGSIDDWEGVTITEEPDPNTLHLVEPISETSLSDDSPPQRHGEDRGRVWYYDILENNSDNDEIRDLLERRTVSNFLASSFRERMDQLILSVFQRQRQQTIVESTEEEEENPIEYQYQEVSDDSDQVAFTSLQLPLPSRLRSWSQYQDQVSDDSYQVASTSLQLPQSSQSYYQDRQQRSPFINQLSLEMELIYDLRGHMENLHHEMFELRKSVEICMGMQLKLQKSIKQEVSEAVSHSIQGGETVELYNRAPTRKGNCCICYEMQVDSLLYRCGHMCTCFKCAHELHWSSGRCPICRAPIVDVVRAYSDS